MYSVCVYVRVGVCLCVCMRLCVHVCVSILGHGLFVELRFIDFIDFRIRWLCRLLLRRDSTSAFVEIRFRCFSTLARAHVYLHLRCGCY